jgi:hypothetical protein
MLFGLAWLAAAGDLDLISLPREGGLGTRVPGDHVCQRVTGPEAERSWVTRESFM